MRNRMGESFFYDLYSMTHNLLDQKRQYGSRIHPMHSGLSLLDSNFGQDGTQPDSTDILKLQVSSI